MGLAPHVAIPQGGYEDLVSSLNISSRMQGPLGGGKVGKANENWRCVGSRTCQGRRSLRVLL